MFFKASAWALLLLYVVFATAAEAQQKVHGQEGSSAGQRASKAEGSTPEIPSQPSLLNPSEGLSVIGAALESRGRGHSKPDCSHLVHAVYERAGFPYSYASSSDLYAGIDEFHRVTRPQAGDLVVWPGHVGILVNPSQGTFFSALRSGVGVESYSASYWKERGVPRFYRYAKGEATKVKEARAGTSGLTHVALDVSENPQKMTSVDVSPTNIQLPQVPVINSARPQPGEVTQVILFTLSIDPEGLRERDVFKLARPLFVFSRLEVRTVKIHGDLGQAQVRMTVPLSVAGDGQPNLKRRQETQMWPLRRRDQKSWELLLPHDVIYMPRDTAVRILAHQLMLLAESESSSASLPQKSQLAQMLKTILVE